jgi:hypothetical protein
VMVRPTNSFRMSRAKTVISGSSGTGTLLLLW